MATEWDKNEPQGGRSLKSSDDKLRKNFEMLEEGLDREHIFPGDSGALGDSGLHKEGSVRVFARAAPTLSAFSNAKASSLGMVMYDLTSKRVYFCSDGATDTWVEVGAIGEALQLSKALTASGGLFLPTGQLIVGPQGESWIGEGIEIDTISVAAAAVVKTKTAHGLTNGDTVRIGGSDCTPTIDGNRVITVVDTTSFSVPVTTSLAGNNGQVAVDFMDPHLHAARHLNIGKDPIAFLIDSVYASGINASSGTLTGSYSSIATTPTISHSAVTGTRRMLFIGGCLFGEETPALADLRFRINQAAPLGVGEIRNIDTAAGASGVRQWVSHIFYAEAVPTSENYTVSLQALASSSLITASYKYIIVIDLGAE